MLVSARAYTELGRQLGLIDPSRVLVRMEWMTKGLHWWCVFQCCFGCLFQHRWSCVPRTTILACRKSAADSLSFIQALLVLVQEH